MLSPGFMLLGGGGRACSDSGSDSDSVSVSGYGVCLFVFPSWVVLRFVHDKLGILDILVKMFVCWHGVALVRVSVL